MSRGTPKVWIRKRTTSGGVSYSLRWRENGTMRSDALGRVGKEFAERLRVKKEYELAFGNGKTEPQEVTWEEFVEDHLRFTEAKKSHGTYALEERLLRQIGEFARPAKLSDLTYERIEAFFTHRRLDSEASPATLNKQIRTLRSILNRAVKRGYLRDNPAKKLDFWTEPEKRLRVLVLEEVRKLLDAAPTAQWRTFLYLTLTCGLRVGEVYNLRWQDLDLERGLLMVENRPHWQTKSRKNRMLGLNHQAILLLRKLRADGEGSDYVFTTAGGNQWRNNVQRQFGRIVKKAGLEHCTLHDLRRTFCTEISKKVPPKVLMELAGHSSLTVTERYYLANVREQQVKEAAECLPY